MKTISLILLIIANTAFSIDQRIIDHLKKNTPTLIIETFDGFNLDPLYSEYGKNVYISGLVSEPPLRLKLNGELSSRILNYFHKFKNKVVFTVSKDAKFNDDSLITANDVAMTIKRYARSVPTHATLSFLVGIDKWLEKEYPLQHEFEGIKVEGDNVVLTFVNENISPFMWAADHPVGIVPEKQIDKLTGEIIGGTPLSSGGFWIKDGSYPIVQMTGKSDISIVGINPNEWHLYAKYISSNHVATTDSGYFTHDNYKKLLNYGHLVEDFTHPNNRFQFIYLVDSKPPFDNKRVRQFFTSEIRRTIEMEGDTPQGSIITKITAGYEPLCELNRSLTEPFSDNERREIVDYLKQYEIVPTFKAKENFIALLNKTAKRLDLRIGNKNNDTFNVSCFYSGVDAAVPVKHYIDLLTPSPEPTSFKVALNDPMLQELVSQISADNPSAESIREMNRYLFDKSVIAGIKHNHIVHYVSKDTNIIKRKHWIFSAEDYFF
ncbi:MAG: hypothetical protein AB8G05_22175 [Oligoflexales bacterium]